jgi:Domain of unknown function (DUF397)
MEQLDPRWRKASYSGNGGADCVEIGTVPGAVFIRDTKDRESGPVLRVRPGEWRRFTAATKRGDTRLAEQ